MSLVVALIGKQNVGKSTIFNRFINKKQAIVNNQPGVTRDRIYGHANWLNKDFDIIDTGGLSSSNFSFKENIQFQVSVAISDADLILFVTSAKEGVNADDFYVAKLLKKDKTKKNILVVNKSESIKNVNEKQYYALGFGKPYFISAEHSIGIGDLLDEIIKTKPSIQKRVKNYAFCIIGKTNVGKSTLLNAIVNEERVIVSPIPHTTRDAIDVDFSYNKQKYTIIDTAGIRRKGKIIDDIEKYAVLRTENAVKRSDLVILVLDGSLPFAEQDEIIGGIAFDSNLPTIICVNKWDAVKKDTYTMNKVIEEIRNKFKYLYYAPIIFISAKDKTRLETIFETIEKIKIESKMQVSTSLLNGVLNKAQINNPSPKHKGSRLNISYGTQVNGRVPTFVIFTNDPKHLHFTYARYIENQIRESFGIKNVPIIVYYKDKNSRIRHEEK